MHTKFEPAQSDAKAAFDAACVDVFHSRLQRAFVELPGHALLPRFTQHYERLCTFPRHMRRSLQRRWKRTLGGVALLLALTPSTTLAATMNVAANTAPDINADGKCSLIEAIVNANRDQATHRDCPAGNGADSITLPDGSSQTLTQSVGTVASESSSALYPYYVGLPEIRSRIVIQGRSTIARADQASLDLVIAVARTGNLTLQNTIISGRPANAAAADNYVVGVLNRGTLSITNGGILRANGFYDAGALINGGVAILKQSTISHSRGYWGGGGISNQYNARLELTDSVLSDNSSEYLAGGLDNSGVAIVRRTAIVRNNAGVGNAGELTVDNSVIADNSSYGGITNYLGGTATIMRTTISNNTAQWWQGNAGGGVFNGGHMTLANSTVSGNLATGYGGGIAAWQGTLILSNTTITDNRANTPEVTYYQDGSGGGLFVGSDAVVRIERSLISGNQAQDRGPEIGRARPNAPVIAANNFNVFGHSGRAGIPFTPGPTDIVPAGPLGSIVMPLANNGGKGMTHALATASVALNAAPVDAACVATDQRGNPRPQGVKCDIGAFEGAAVLCNGLTTTQVGTANNDTLTGTAGRDVIAGLAGGDTIRGLDNNDVICAGSGADKVYGGNGNDLLFGDADNDKLYGDAGNDALSGGSGTDICNGGSNTDTTTQCERVTGVP